MSTADTNNIGIKLQSAGENLNTWGDPNLNNDLIVLSNIGSKWNALTINGDTTISETNYATTNDTEVATIDLVAGTVAAAFNVVFPGRDKRLVIRNSTSYAATLKLSATSGFALPAGRIVIAATDGTTDVVNVTPNYGGKTSPTAGSVDIPAWSAVETAVATATIPASAGTVLESGTDTTAKYHGTAHAAATANHSYAVTGSGSETLTSTVVPLALIAGAAKTTSFTAAVNTAYPLAKSAALTITMPASASVSDVVWVDISGAAGLVTWDLNGLKAYGSTVNPTSAQEGIQVWRYSGASRGWIDL